jgi:hypothetical protein
LESVYKVGSLLVYRITTLAGALFAEW